jgi:hypothetical protein
MFAVGILGMFVSVANKGFLDSEAYLETRERKKYV